MEGSNMRLTAITLFIGTLVVAAAPSYACFCLVDDVPEAFQRAGAVFAGRVVQIIPPKTRDMKRPLIDRSYTIKFRVEESWKGQPSDEIKVLLIQGPIECLSSPGVSVGERYLVYADPLYGDANLKSSLLGISVCSRTALLPQRNYEPHFIAETTRKAKPLLAQEFNRLDGSEDIRILEQIKDCGCLPLVSLTKCRNPSESVWPESPENKRTYASSCCLCWRARFSTGPSLIIPKLNRKNH
jgi:hypothetical protein